MLTELGKYLRKLRIDNQEVLRDMAQKLEVSPAYLSAVEIGKRNIPAGWIPQIISMYSLSKNEAEELKNAAERSVQELRISLSNISDQKKDTVLSFAKALDGLSDNDLKGEQ